MNFPDGIVLSDEVHDALSTGGAVVALESTLITHGLPYPVNLETAREAESAVRAAGAVPATIAIVDGGPTVGLDAATLERLANTPNLLKASRRDLATAVAFGRTAGTTVAATMALAHAVGIRVFATGGIGGVHRNASDTFDISADLHELSRTPVMVVCAGAKSILDLPKTLEVLETLGVPVVGYRTDHFPAFYVRSSGLLCPVRVETPSDAARLFAAHRRMGPGGCLLTQPIDEAIAIPERDFQQALDSAMAEAETQGIRGPNVTPFLLARIAAALGDRALQANRRLIVANAALAGAVARCGSD
jgi:pseudouridylate synthase